MENIKYRPASARYKQIMEEVEVWMMSPKLSKNTKIDMWKVLKQEKKKNDQISRNGL